MLCSIVNFIVCDFMEVIFLRMRPCTGNYQHKRSIGSIKPAQAWMNLDWTFYISSACVFETWYFLSMSKGFSWNATKPWAKFVRWPDVQLHIRNMCFLLWIDFIWFKYANSRKPWFRSSNFCDILWQWRFLDGNTFFDILSRPTQKPTPFSQMKHVAQ